MLHSGSKATYPSQHGKRIPRKRPQSSKQIKANDSNDEYDYIEDEPPPNPKKGKIRLSKRDPEYEYEYYDPDDINEEADDENEYDFIEEARPPEKIIIARLSDANGNPHKHKNEPVIVKTYTEGEYNQLIVSKPDPIKLNPALGEKLIKVSAKYENEHQNAYEPEIMVIKKSEKSIKEDELRKEQKKFVPKSIAPKLTYNEIRNQKAENREEENIKRYEDAALQYALEEERKAAQEKIIKKMNRKDNEENFVKESIKKMQQKRKEN